MSSDADIQKDYYAKTADQYNEMHVHAEDEHYFSASFVLGMLDHLKIQSILDVGSGTGRMVGFIQQHRPEIKIIGIEPVAELRQIAYQQGISEQILINGNALKLDFADASFDLVCEFGVLHHIKTPEIAVAEMLRVAKTAIFISDSNNFGQGSATAKLMKQTINAFGLWKLADWIKTKGKGYTLTQGDGLAYSYSVFNNYHQIQRQCQQIHTLNIAGNGINPYRHARHVALLGIKKF